MTGKSPELKQKRSPMRRQGSLQGEGIGGGPAALAYLTPPSKVEQKLLQQGTGLKPRSVGHELTSLQLRPLGSRGPAVLAETRDLQPGVPRVGSHIALATTVSLEGAARQEERSGAGVLGVRPTPCC